MLTDECPLRPKHVVPKFLHIQQTFSIVPVGLSYCLFVCYHDGMREGSVVLQLYIVGDVLLPRRYERRFGCVRLG